MAALTALIASLAKFSKKKWVLAEAEKLKRHFSQAYTYYKLAEAIYAIDSLRLSQCPCGSNERP